MKKCHNMEDPRTGKPREFVWCSHQPYPEMISRCPESQQRGSIPRSSRQSSSTLLRSSYHQNSAKRKPLSNERRLAHSNTCSRRPRSRHTFHSPFSSYKLALTLIFVSSLHQTLARRPQCLLDPSWKGEWFISGLSKPVLVDETSISHKGECVQKATDRYLFKNLDYGCYRCLVIHQKHTNVIQYKETYCGKERMTTIEDACTNLAGDAQLHSLFRIGAEPVPCPFHHTYVFSYNRGTGECSDPKSAVFSCTDDWRLLFQYQACPDVKGTESKSEELKCLAVWKEGSNRFLVGKSNHPLATSDEDRYRCFVYDSWSRGPESGFHVAQSGDATCNGLFSVNDGSRTLSLTKVDSATLCRFPRWAGGTHWHSLDGGEVMRLTKHNSTLKLSGHAVMGGPATHSCFREESSNGTSAIFVSRVTHGCNSGYQCIQLIFRDSYVLELKMGKLSPPSDPDAACSPHYFEAASEKFTTFISGKAESKNCPGIGRYEALAGPSKGAIFPSHGRGGMTIGSCEEEALTALLVGCSSSDTIQIHTTCANSEYSCHGWWEEAGWRYLVVTPVSRSSKGVRRLCLVINKGDRILSLASSSKTCMRELHPTHHGLISFNSTSNGRCETFSAENASWSVSQQRSLTFWWLCLWCVLYSLTR